MIANAWKMLVFGCVTFPASCFVEFSFFLGGNGFRQSVRPIVLQFHQNKLKAEALAWVAKRERKRKQKRQQPARRKRKTR